MYNPGTNNQQQLKALLAKIEEKKSQLVRQQEDLDAMFEDLKLWEKNCNEALSNA
jgi:peptidoglycan hydrolase CwlO-like protein